MTQNEMPVGFAMALAMNPEAMQSFALMSRERQQEVIAGVHGIRSRNEMHRYVNGLVK